MEKRNYRTLLATFVAIPALVFALTAGAVERQKLNFNADWRLCIGDNPKAIEASFDDSQWQRVTLPYAFNGDEAFRKDIVDLTDTIVWYRKTFEVPIIASPSGGGLEGWGGMKASPSGGGLEGWGGKKASPTGGGLEGAKYFIEFEGVRQGADVYLNGHHLGFSENGVMAFGFDLTPLSKRVKT